MTTIRLLASIGAILFSATAAAATPVPELDPSGAATGLALLAGALLVINGRRR
jgi:hypothetical protein